MVPVLKITNFVQLKSLEADSRNHVNNNNNNDGCHESGKRHITDGMEIPNPDRIRTLEENETYKYLGILEADTIKQV